MNTTLFFLALALFVALMFAAIRFGSPATQADRADLVDDLRFVPENLYPQAEKIVQDTLGKRWLQRRDCLSAQGQIHALVDRAKVAEFEAPFKAKSAIEKARSNS